jgi:hypothetical protein
MSGCFHVALLNTSGQQEVGSGSQSPLQYFTEHEKVQIDCFRIMVT